MYLSSFLFLVNAVSVACCAAVSCFSNACFCLTTCATAFCASKCSLRSTATSIFCSIVIWICSIETEDENSSLSSDRSTMTGDALCSDRCCNSSSRAVTRSCYDRSASQEGMKMYEPCCIDLSQAVLNI